MAKGGRPPTPEDEQLVNVIRLTNKHVAMLDRVIRERSRRDLSCVVTEPEQEVPGTNVTVRTSRVDGINYVSERRKLVAELIEQTLTTAVLYPTRVSPVVPPGPYSNVELLGTISSWAEQESLRLTASAPLPIKLVLERNKLRHMERELSPKEYLKQLQATTGTAPDDDVGTGRDAPRGGSTIAEAGAVTTADDETS